MLGFILFLGAPNTAYRRAAIPHLKERFPDEWAPIWRSTCTWQSRLAASRPHHSASVNIMMRHMEWSCALYRALKDHGMSQDEAGSLVEAVAMDDYRPVPATWSKLSRLRSTKPGTRAKWVLGLVTRYFFSSPFVHRHLPAEGGVTVAFDVTVCPLADYFKDQGVPELTMHAACNLDNCLARALGVELFRTQTIADGDEYCNFRWKLPEVGNLRAPHRRATAPQGTSTRKAMTDPSGKRDAESNNAF
jgi:L-2-amino-thiazoline-4-carboxylic acid hydrolase